MRSNDEEYLDSLLNSAQSNKIKPDSALGRMSPKVRASSENSASLEGAGGISALVNNSGGNEDLNEIGALLDKLDRDEILDEGMAQMLDDIARPTDSSIPKFTVGNNPTSDDTRDPEEIALDEAIADAERLEAEIQSGKFNDAYSNEDKAASIVDIEEGDDALLEMAPEIALPDEKITDIGPDRTSDANESPEEILNGLLDEDQESNLALSDEIVSGESLSDALDNIQEEADPFEVPDSAVVADILGNSGDVEAPADQVESFEDLESMLEPEAPDEAAEEPPVDTGADVALDAVSDIPEEAPVENIEDNAIEEDNVLDDSSDSSSDKSSDEFDLDNMSMDDLEAEMKNLMGEDVAPAESIPEDVDLGGFTFDGLDASVTDEVAESSEQGDSGSSDQGDSADIADAAGEGELSLEDLMSESVEAEESDSAESDAPAEGAANESGDPDEFNLDDMEASLDNLLGGEAGDLDSIEGEVATIADLDDTGEAASEGGAEGGGDVSIPDLDALMNSLANDEIEDLESTAQMDAEAGVAENEEPPKEDILDALTEDAFNEEGGGEPSLEDLAAIPERKSASDEEEEPEGGKKKKKGLFGLIAKFINTLTEEEPDGSEGLASLTDENQTVLNELAKDEKPKKEKKKKEKKPKEKKPAKPKKPKEKKPPKPKKEKKPKEPKEPGAPEKVISPKKIALSGLFAASIGIFVFIPSLILPDRIANERASTAYEREEYATAYKMLYGKKMSEEQEVVYEQSRVLAWSERYLTGYQNYVEMGMKEEALDMLLMGMRSKEDLLEEAAKFNVEIQVQSVYDSIESVLAEKYSLSSDDVDEINSIKKDRDYTIRLMEIVGTL